MFRNCNLPRAVVVAGEPVTLAACLWHGQPFYEQKYNANL